ncbi:hypothetical protein [Alkalihalobacillus sp. 1P02AB]|uniref:hypothetical protein n=1 Tax=Alkalihalobacillus sp. 1P02AB TaxID=3132260 RepID=UPI0039A4B1D6
MNQQHNMEQIKTSCQQYMNQPVSVQYQGQVINGVIENVDDEQLYLLVAVDDNGQYVDLAQLMQEQHQSGSHQAQQFQRNPYYNPYPAYYPSYYYPSYYPYPRPINWNRLVLPLAALTAIALL